MSEIIKLGCGGERMNKDWNALCDPFVGAKIEDDGGARLLQRFDESVSALRSKVEEGYNHWIITFSGGKDSTTAVVVALETALTCLGQIEAIDIVYSDTMVEIPVIRQFALSFLERLKSLDRIAGLPVYYHAVYPAVEERFWVCLLGKGYPPPHQRFRWCTRRLKIQPVEHALKAFITAGRTLILTGVRLGESRSRDISLYRSCKRGGECGQGLWFRYSSRLQAGYMAPIVEWSECDVWDFLRFYAPTLGYPTGYLEDEVYNGRETRFGCWMCTVVRQDKAMEKITSLPEWAHLRPLLNFRQHVKDLTRAPESRVPRADGKLGRLTLEIRQQLLDELLKLEEKIGMTLISPDEIQAIREIWQQEVDR
ncbi:phosphoadenosine phosphosulfate reductase family protein [Thermomicrobiaceae bacterium CFH 74404]|uniref:Phosphoadenosine phosphosulfate reductase family protein n=1 Tax=Thermalbibacter longus TaxID=2951981 RepID=A0AA41W964_9BACT|nr:phosphoadenosine phosphosulfate reductase family protein [Thermalbibacter longus]MCM8747694.1 phosphoadenosine phosphosulfate reductase family protein [Thermalbibacter longus]